MNKEEKIDRCLTWTLIAVATIAIIVIVLFIYNLPETLRPHVRANQFTEPIQTTDYYKIGERLSDKDKLYRASILPPYPKEAFIGETQRGNETLGWYISIKAPCVFSEPYIGYTDYSFRYEVPLEEFNQEFGQ